MFLTKFYPSQTSRPLTVIGELYFLFIQKLAYFLRVFYSIHIKESLYGTLRLDFDRNVVHLMEWLLYFRTSCDEQNA